MTSDIRNFKNRGKKNRCDSGISLMSVTVGLALTGILASIVSQLNGVMFSSQRHSNLRRNLVQVADMIAQRIDCATTEEKNPTYKLSAVLVPVEVYRTKDATPIIEIDGSTLGDFQVLAEGDMYGIKISMSRLSSKKAKISSLKSSVTATDFLPDPLNPTIRWNWAYSDQVLGTMDTSFGRLCGGSLTSTKTNIPIGDIWGVEPAFDTTVSYTVPSGKTLMITNIGGPAASGISTRAWINGVGLPPTQTDDRLSLFKTSINIKSGTTMTFGKNQSAAYSGLLVNEKDVVGGAFWSLQIGSAMKSLPSSSSYSIPANKNLIISWVYGVGCTTGSNRCMINGNVVFSDVAQHTFPAMQAVGYRGGQTLTFTRSTSSPWCECHIIGYVQ